MKNNPLKQAAASGRIALVAATVLALAACGSVPRKLAPPVLRNDVPLAGLKTPQRTGWPATDWWRGYHDPQLDTLIALAMKHSPDLAQAHSRVVNAEQSARLAAAQAGLNINGNAQFERQRLSENGIISLLPGNIGIDPWYNQTDLGLQAKYTFDWWGKKRASIEAALDQTHAAEARRSAAALTIQNAVADTYFGWLGDQARLALAGQLVAAETRLLHIAQLRVKQGVDLPDTVQNAQAQLAATREMRIALQGSAKIRKVALASLVGVAPARLPTMHARALPNVNSRVPAHAGIDLIARRPDIAASRWQVESAIRQTDVARAQFLPDIGISAMAGLSSIDIGELLHPSSRTFAFTPAIHLPIFEGGQLKANYGVSRAQLDAAITQYNATLTTAAREVATQALTAQQIAARRQQQALQVAADRKLVAAARARQRQGIRDARETLAASATWLQQRDNALALHAQAVSTDLALIKALGGGYRLASPADQGPPDTSSTIPSNPSGDDAHERH